MRNICVIGVGYVGLTTGTCFADLGNRVVAVDISEERIANLNKGILPIYEPGLKEMVERNMAAGRLRFSNSYAEGLKDAEFVFICVGTPSGVDGEADLRYVRDAAETIAKTMDRPLIIINKSTVPVGTGDWVSNIINETQPSPIDFAVVSCPEFLREGSALRDFMNPDRTVLGSTNHEAADRVAQLHLPLRAPIIVTDLRTAEMIKYASNAFLATKISFINEIANICEALGADVKEVAAGMGYDTRIGSRFLEAGLGYGGSCFTPEETLYAVEDEKVVAKSLKQLFTEAGIGALEGEIEVIYPENHQVLGFNPQTGCPEVVDVKAFTRRPYQGDMVNIKTSMGRNLKVTADHPVFLFEDSQFNVVAANEVNIGQHMLLLTELPPNADVATQLATLKSALTNSKVDANGLTISITDKFEAEIVSFALQTLGIVAALDATHGEFQLTVNGVEQLLRIKDLLPSEQQSQLNVEGLSDTALPFIAQGTWSTVQVADVEIEEVSQDVYSLETTTGVVIVGSGLISHQCFPKDVKALAHMANIHGRHPQMLEAVMEINDDQRMRFIAKLEEMWGDLNGKVVGLLGLAFKENTDDMREAPSLTIADYLHKHGAIVKGYDPVAMEHAHRMMPFLQLSEDSYELATGCDAIVVITPWNEFKNLDMPIILEKMKGNVLLDGRNLYEPAKMRELGYDYRGVGRGYQVPNGK